MPHTGTQLSRSLFCGPSSPISPSLYVLPSWTCLRCRYNHGFVTINSQQYLYNSRRAFSSVSESETSNPTTSSAIPKSIEEIVAEETANDGSSLENKATQPATDGSNDQNESIIRHEAVMRLFKIDQDFSESPETPSDETQSSITKTSKSRLRNRLSIRRQFEYRLHFQKLEYDSNKNLVRILRSNTPKGEIDASDITSTSSSKGVKTAHKKPKSHRDTLNNTKTSSKNSNDRQSNIEPKRATNRKIILQGRRLVSSTAKLLTEANQMTGTPQEKTREFHTSRSEANAAPVGATAEVVEAEPVIIDDVSILSKESGFDETDLFKTHKYDIMFRARDIKERIIDVPTGKPPRLHHGLDRVLFNPGVFHLRNQRTGVFNFDPYLQKIDPVTSYDIDAMSAFTTPSEDKVLSKAAVDYGCRYTASTSSSTDLLKHLHYILSNARQLNDSMLSKGFETPQNIFFTTGQRKPSAVFLRFKKGEDGQPDHYSVDSDSHLDNSRELSLTGILLEKLLTSSKEELQKYKLQDGETEANLSDEDLNKAHEGSYHYTAYGKILVRSQLDAYDPRLPGSGIFDLKTRACAAVRLDWEERSLAHTSNYQVRDSQGLWESFEREQYDLMRTAMLKYSLQVRLGRMDGIFVAYHNTSKMFGFQYMPLEDLDFAIHGQKDRSLGDQELALSLALLEEVFDRATKRFPEQSLWVHFDTRFWKAGPFLRIFVEPITAAKVDKLKKQAKERRQRHAAAESSRAMMESDLPALTREELSAVKESALKLAESSAALIRTMEENKLATVSELAEFDYTEDQILDLLKGYMEVITTMDRFEPRSPPAADTIEIDDQNMEAEIVVSVNEALAECQPLVELFPEQWEKAQEIIKFKLFSKPSTAPAEGTLEESETPEELYLKAHEPTELASWELRVVNYVAGQGFVERPTQVVGRGSHRKMSVRANLKEVDTNTAKRTYDIMRRARLQQTKPADKFYEGWFFNNLLKLSEAGRRWSAKQEMKYSQQEVVRFEPYDSN